MTLAAYLDNWRRGDSINEWRCKDCEETSSKSQKTPSFQYFGDHVFVEINRTDADGKNLRDLVIVDTDLKLSPHFGLISGFERQLFRAVEHYQVLKKTGLEWWLCNDVEVSASPPESLIPHTQAAMLLMRRKRQWVVVSKRRRLVIQLLAICVIRTIPLC